MLHRKPSRIEVKPEDRQEEYDELRKAHVKKLQDELALKGPPSSSGRGGEGIDLHPVLREPSAAERIGFVANANANANRVQ